jgi:hypothetical protein
MQGDDRPEDDHEARFARLVVEHALRQPGARPSAEQRHQLQRRFADAPVAADCALFVDSIHRERDDAHERVCDDDRQDQLAGSQRVLFFARGRADSSSFFERSVVARTRIASRRASARIPRARRRDSAAGVIGTRTNSRCPHCALSHNQAGIVCPSTRYRSLNSISPRRQRGHARTSPVFGRSPRRRSRRFGAESGLGVLIR